MLEKTILANSIYSALQSDSSVESYMSKIKEHLESATIMVNYVGVIPSVPPTPDPLSGPYSLQVQIVPTFVQGALIKTLLSSLQEANPQLFVDTIINSLAGTLVKITSPVIIAVPLIYLTSPVNVVTLKQAKTALDSWLILAEAVVNALKLSLTTTLTPPMPTVSQSGGTGVSTLISIV